MSDKLVMEVIWEIGQSASSLRGGLVLSIDSFFSWTEDRGVQIVCDVGQNFHGMIHIPFPHDHVPKQPTLPRLPSPFHQFTGHSESRRAEREIYSKFEIPF